MKFGIMALSLCTASLTALVPPTRIAPNPVEMERLGVATGSSVRVTSTRGSLTFEAVADGGVPKGSAALLFNVLPHSAGDLIDIAAPVTDVRVETL